MFPLLVGPGVSITPRDDPRAFIGQVNAIGPQPLPVVPKPDRHLVGTSS